LWGEPRGASEIVILDAIENLVQMDLVDLGRDWVHQRALNKHCKTALKNVALLWGECVQNLLNLRRCCYPNRLFFLGYL